MREVKRTAGLSKALIAELIPSQPLALTSLVRMPGMDPKSRLVSVETPFDIQTLEFGTKNRAQDTSL